MKTNVSWWQEPLFMIVGKPISAVEIFLIIALLIGGFWLSGVFKRFMTTSRKIERVFVDKSVRYILAIFGKYIILIITFLIIMETAGIDMSSLAVVAGALGVGIGFGLQNIVNNFISGIILMTERSIKVDDVIEIGSNVGRVSEIRLRSTVIVTFDRIEIVVPNSELVGSRVFNRTLSSPVRRIAVSFGVEYGTKTKRVNEVVLGALNSSNLVFLRDPAPYIKMSSLSDSSVDFDLYIYLNQNDPKSSHPGDFLALVYEALNEGKVSMPYPQMDVFVKNLPR